MPLANASVSTAQAITGHTLRPDVPHALPRNEEKPT
jgi:hypothetical protein